MVSNTSVNYVIVLVTTRVKTNVTDVKNTSANYVIVMVTTRVKRNVTNVMD